MAGETNLQRLLQSMNPELRDGAYVFVTLPTGQYGDHAHLCPIAMFQEEALSLVIPQAAADQYGVAYESVFRCITLTVHSSLDAVGLTAAFATQLAQHGISANVIAAYYHDHIFVQAAEAQQAVALLQKLADS